MEKKVRWERGKEDEVTGSEIERELGG